LNTNVIGRVSSVSAATYETEKISAAGFSFFLSTTHVARAVYAIEASPPVQTPVVSAPVGGSYSFFASVVFASSLMGGHATRRPAHSGGASVVVRARRA